MADILYVYKTSIYANLTNKMPLQMHILYP